MKTAPLPPPRPPESMDRARGHPLRGNDFPGASALSHPSGPPGHAGSGACPSFYRNLNQR